MSASLILTDEELHALTGYRRGAEQLAELHRQGFSRARRDRLGRVVLERAHYEAVSRAEVVTSAAPAPQLRPPRLRTA